jgi:hypothetical protein
LVSLIKKCIFEHCREFQARKSQLIDIIFAMKKLWADLFRAAPYMFMLVLHKDARFHSPKVLLYWATNALIIGTQLLQ